MMRFVIATALLAAGAMAGGPTNHELECQACEEAIGLVDFMLNTPFVKDSLKNLVYEQCNHLPSPYNAECNATVSTGFDLIVKDLQSFLNVTCARTLNCTSIDAAIGKLLSRLPSTTTAGDTAPCAIFELMYKDMPTEVQYFKKVCTELPANLQQGCTAFFEQHPDLVVQIGRGVLKSLINTIPFMHCDFSAPTAAPIVMAADPLACMGCNDGVQVLNFMLSSPLAEGALKHVLGVACQSLPEAYRADCNTTVYAGIDMIVKDIESFTDVICQRTLGCPAAPSAAFTGSLLDADKGSVCSVVKMIYGEIPSAIASFRPICAHLSTASAQQNCDKLFDNDSADLVKYAQTVVKKLSALIPFAHCDMA